MITVNKYEKKGVDTAYVECVCDTDTDIAQLPKASANWIAGSTAFVISSGKVLMRNSSNEWREI